MYHTYIYIYTHTCCDKYCTYIDIDKYMPRVRIHSEQKHTHIYIYIPETQFNKATTQVGWHILKGSRKTRPLSAVPSKTRCRRRQSHCLAAGEVRWCRVLGAWGFIFVGWFQVCLWPSGLFSWLSNTIYIQYTYRLCSYFFFLSSQWIWVDQTISNQSWFNRWFCWALVESWWYPENNLCLGHEKESYTRNCTLFLYFGVQFQL